jgi:hypothetical protein
MHELNASPSECVSELELDELLAGELSAADQQRCEAHLATCSACRARKQAIEQTNSAFYAQAPSFAALSRLTGAVAPKPARSRSNLRWLGAPLLAACAALGFIAMRSGDQPAPAHETRSKGAPRLGYYVKRGESVSRGESATVVHPGDALRFVYSADRSYYLAIFSADARGVGVYFPSGPSAELVSAGQEVALDFSVALDETLGRERVTAMFCPEAFDVDAVQSALSSGSALPAQLARCERVGFEINKLRAPANP